MFIFCVCLRVRVAVLRDVIRTERGNAQTGKTFNSIQFQLVPAVELFHN